MAPLTSTNRVIIIGFLLGISVLLTYYFHAVLSLGAVYSHFFYIPIILTALWWEKKGILVAVLLGGLVLASSFFLRPDLLTMNDLGRALMFVVVAFVVSSLSGQLNRQQKALEKERDRAEGYLNVAAVLLVVINADQTIGLINHRGAELLGYREDELVGKNWFDTAVPERIRKDARRAFIQAVSGAAATAFEADELVIVTHSGEERILVWREAILRDEDGRITGILGSGKDITDRKQAEERLRESEARVRLKLESILSPEGDIGNLELADIIDLPAVQSLMDDVYTLAKIPVAIIDNKGKVLVGAGWQEICMKYHRVHPEACRHCMESDTELSTGIPAGESKMYRCKNNMWDVATPIIVGGRHLGNLFSGQFFFEGEELDYELFRSQARRYGFNEQEYIAALEAVPRLNRESVDTAMAFFRKFADFISRLSYSNIKLARSLTERDALMESLKEAGDRLRRTQEIAHLGSWELDLVNQQLTWSDEVYRILGLQPEEFEATYEAFLELVHPDDREFVDAAYRESLREGQASYEIEHRIIRRSTGEVRWVHEKGEHFRNGAGRSIRSIGMIHDITERKKAEEALRAANEEANLYLDIMVHDINNTNTVALAYSEILGDELAGGDKAMMEKIRSSVNRSIEIIENVSTIRRLRSPDPVLKPVDLDAVIQAEIRRHPDTPIIYNGRSIWVSADDLLPEVFVNLIGNSIKFGEPDVGVRVQVKESEEAVEVVVEDAGPGISDTVKPTLFSRFQSGKSKRSGKGLGLYIVRMLVERYGGSIRVEDRIPGSPEQGALFRFTLNRAKESDRRHEKALQAPELMPEGRA